MPGARWLALLLQHVPNPGEHLVRYYGWYSNRARGMRRDRTTQPTFGEGTPEHTNPELSRAARWPDPAHLRTGSRHRLKR